MGSLDVRTNVRLVGTTPRHTRAIMSTFLETGWCCLRHAPQLQALTLAPYQQSLLTAGTVQRRADHGGPALRRLHPGPDLPWGLVPHMLQMAAFQFGHPIPLGIFVKSDDPPPHTSPGEIFVRVCLTAKCRCP